MSFVSCKYHKKKAETFLPFFREKVVGNLNIESWNLMISERTNFEEISFVLTIYQWFFVNLNWRSKIFVVKHFQWVIKFERIKYSSFKLGGLQRQENIFSSFISSLFSSGKSNCLRYLTPPKLILFVPMK